MCGILGVWNRNGRPVDLPSFQRGLTTIRHRGPDDEGYLLTNTATGRLELCGGLDTPGSLRLSSIEEFFGESFDLVLGSRRLAILDPTPAGHQPMGREDGRRWTVHNGEIYNYIELRNELMGMGHSFQTASDTEVALAAYAEWGTDSLNRLIGMWATVIWDTKERRLVASRDRFGIKPFVFSLSPDVFAFASEAKALLQLTGPRPPDSSAVLDYLASGRVDHASRTFFSGFASLEPGSILRIGRDYASSSKYWDLENETGKDTRQFLDNEESASRFRELLTESVSTQLRSDVPVGSALSGGLDSSTIVSIVSRLLGEAGIERSALGERQKTFTASFTDPTLDERRYADAVVAASGAEGHFTSPTSTGLISALPDLVWHQDEPFGSTSIYAQWCVMDLAHRNGVKVLLDGQGADEILAGYVPFFESYLATLTRTGDISALLESAAFHPAGRSVGLLKAIWRASPHGVFIRGNRWRARRRWPGWLASDFDSQHVGSWDRLDLKTQLVRSVSGGLRELLRYEDRNSMAFGIEARVPFLDHRLVSFVLALPPDNWVSNGWTKAILRRAMEGVVPPEVLSRRDKIGFQTPQRAWLTEVWPSFREILGDQSFRRLPYFDARGVDRELHQIDRHGLDPSQESTVWRWVSLKLWHDRFQNPSTG